MFQRLAPSDLMKLIASIGVHPTRLKIEASFPSPTDRSFAPNGCFHASRTIDGTLLGLLPRSALQNGPHARVWLARA